MDYHLIMPLDTFKHLFKKNLLKLEKSNSKLNLYSHLTVIKHIQSFVFENLCFCTISQTRRLLSVNLSQVQTHFCLFDFIEMTGCVVYGSDLTWKQNGVCKASRNKANVFALRTERVPPIHIITVATGTPVTVLYLLLLGLLLNWQTGNEELSLPFCWNYWVTER